MPGRGTSIGAIAFIVGIALPVSIGTARAIAEANGPADAVGGYASTHIVVKFTPGVIKPRDAPEAGEPGGQGGQPRSVSTSPAGLDAAGRAVWDQWGVRSMRRACPFADPKVAARYGLDRTYILEVPAGTDTRAMATAFRASGAQVEFAEVDPIGGVAQLVPNDEHFWRQYGMHNTGQTGGTVDADIDAPEAWELYTGAVGAVTVAIVDSGVDPHPEYLGRLLPGHNTDDPAAPDLTADDCPHGTHVAGIVAAEGNNIDGVAGVVWGANVLPVRVLGHPSPCSGYETAAAAGIIWAVDHGAAIVNMSLQYCQGTQTFEDAVDYAHEHGALVVSAAGNDNLCGSGVIAAPARFANSMGVSATTDRDLLAGFSNWGAELDVCAPGGSIYSTWISDSYTYMSGTSMATPHVSGLAALLKSYAPELTHDDIRGILVSTVDDLGPVGWDSSFGYGRINAYNAMESIYEEQAVPAASAWGLLAMTLLILSAGTLVLMRCRVHA